ncbi:TonB-dependent receptor [Sinorhizobium meliloti]|uniref:TonB-dependent receptor n=1 Tax=Rhizobium meliloti TaxID=382 RepID=UPI000FD3F148|nr:TonB-dependent receptor [Sinorhizobium meliloti]RVK05309.1 TonB-dependent receptor [Sinorhizobium meliloti]RVL48234.1 TonB-dependent receptor [Sinorhizobium meliloti]RVL64496.1 TonB-dependent receptor [Sinorhizobium meliloti]RVP53298.1 TonB-dependent receptor [Sinorhizobium meliloti]RVP84579.1 TonB-dependent receptor [Sinorhizobium meliloti]
MTGRMLVVSTNPDLPSAAGRWLRAEHVHGRRGTLRKKPSFSPRWRVALPMIVTFCLVWLGYLSIVTIVVATDPYDIYRWGARLKLTRNDVPRDVVVRWVDLVSKQSGINTFLVGGSTTAMYSPDDISAVLGENVVAYNLSYGGPRPMDRDIVLDQLAINAQAKRIIITFDWMYILDPEKMRQGFPEYLYDEEISDDIRMVDLKSLRRTWKVLLGETSYEAQDDKRYAKFTERQYRSFQMPAQMAELQALIEEYRSVVDAPSGRTCASFNAVNEQLVPRIRKFVEKGAQVDVIMPILSYANYYFRMSDISATLLDEVLLSRRCFVKSIDTLPNVRVFAWDDDPRIAGDLGNFRDPGHVYNPGLLRRTLTSLSTGENRLTAADVEAYERRIRTEVKNYRLRNSYLERTARK